MPPGQAIWRTGPNQFLSADIHGLRLVVEGPERAGEPARFQIMRQEAGGQRVIIGSGTEADLRAAMAAAEEMARRLAGQPPGND